MADDGQLLPPLTCVVVVCRESPRVAALAHVVHILSDFLDVSLLLRFDEACALPSLYQAQRITARDALEPVGSPRRSAMYRQWRFSIGLPTAVAAGDLRLVQWLVGYFPRFQVPTQVVSEAACHGRLEILQWLQAQGRDLHARYDEVERALKANHADVAMWLNANVPSATREAARTRWPAAAAAAGNLRMVQWSFRQLVNSRSGTGRVHTAVQLAVDAAARAGDRAILEWFLNDDEMKKSSVVNLSRVADGGHFEVMRWLWGHYRTNVHVGHALHVTVRTGRLDILQWLYEQNLGSYLVNALDMAAGKGHLAIVKWLHELQSEICTHHTRNAVINRGSLHGMRRLLGNGAAAMDAAAAGGHLSVVQWLHENRTEGCTIKAMDGAATGGHLDVVQWLHTNRSEGCSKSAMDGAAANGHLEVVMWLSANHLEGCTSAAIDGAAANGHLEVVQWLHTKRTEGCTVHAMDGAANGGHLMVVQWLHSNRTEGCTTSAMDDAAGKRDLELVQWLHLNRDEGCTTSAMDGAASSGHFDVILYLHQERTEGCSSNAVAGAARSGHRELLFWFERYYPAQFQQWRSEFQAENGDGLSLLRAR